MCESDPDHVCVVSQFQDLCVSTRPGRDMALLECTSAAVDGHADEKQQLLLASAHEILVFEDTCR
jgi:hypothetical protein